MTDPLYSRSNLQRLIEQERRKFETLHGGAIPVVINQYTRAASALTDLFASAPDLCSQTDGVGCCEDPCFPIEATLSGPATFELIAQQRKRRADDGMIPQPGACYFHKADSGCVLGELKPPICLSHYCEGLLDATEYHHVYVLRFLDRILNPPIRNGQFTPSENEPLLDEFMLRLAEWEKQIVTK